MSLIYAKLNNLVRHGFILIPPLVFDPEGSSRRLPVWANPKGGRTDTLSVTIRFLVSDTLSDTNEGDVVFSGIGKMSNTITRIINLRRVSDVN